MAKFRRRIYFIDPKVQGALMVRVAVYWLYCIFTISLMLVWWNLFAGPPRRFTLVLQEVWERFAPGAGASLLIVPLVIMDVLRFSNRFAGPAWRLKGALRELGAGNDVKPIHFRDHDFWREMAEDFNRVAARLSQTADPANPPEEVPEEESEELADEAAAV